MYEIATRNEPVDPDLFDELRQQAISGDELAVTALVKTLLPTVETAIRTHVSHYHDQEELVNTSVIRVLQAMLNPQEESYQKINNPQGWAWRVSTNIAKDKHRRDSCIRMEHQPNEDFESVVGEASVEDEIIARSAYQRIEVLLAASGCNEAQSKALLLSLQGMTDLETATIMNSPLGTAKSRANRARQKLLMYLKQKGFSKSSTVDEIFGEIAI